MSDYVQFIMDSHSELMAESARKDAAIDELVEVGRAVVERWDSPLWKDMPHTGEYISRLRATCDKHDNTKEST